MENTVRKLQNFKVSGYIQGQYQFGEKDASLKVGSGNENPDEAFHRIGIRRGRIKFTYEGNIALGVFQLDMTEKGVGIKDAYFGIKDPWFNSASMIKAGVFDRPFGNEISYSSSRRESPERSMIFQTLFPEERDLGIMLQLQAGKTSPWNILKLEVGLFAGNGIKMETDNRKDFIGHLSVNKDIGSNIKIGGGVSYYYGSVYQGSNKVYKMEENSFVLQDTLSSLNKFAKREYIGFDFQLNVSSILGITQLRAEYLFGQQPGAKSNSKSPNVSTLPAIDTYIRNFSGWYVILVQDFGSLPLSAVLKYDMYDPNTKISKNTIGLQNSSSGDVAYNTFGFGLLWRATNDIRIQAFYEIITNEKSESLAGYMVGKKDNVLTLRGQYRF
ncbi:MAG: hypothetical protein LBV02_07520 [Bacteroidales bacterium]|nr:hypothetical protein [Bacteroidales bacterium]